MNCPFQSCASLVFRTRRRAWEMLAFESQQNSQCLKPHDKFEAKAVLLLGAVPTSVAVASELPLNNWRRDGDGWSTFAKVPKYEIWSSMALHGFMFCHVFMNVFLYFLSGVEEMSGLGIEVALCRGRSSDPFCRVCRAVKSHLSSVFKCSPSFFDFGTLNFRAHRMWLRTLM